MKIYAFFKQAISVDTGLANSLLHIHVGLAIFLAARLITRRPLGSFIPLIPVLVCELANEILDRVNHGSWRWPDTTGDLVNTLLWPTLLCVGARLRSARDQTPASPSDSS